MSGFGGFTAEEKSGEENVAGKIDELRYMQQMYQSQYEVIASTLSMRLGELQELGRAQRSLEESEIVRGGEALLQLGGGFYLRSRVDDVGSVIVGVGGGYLVEKSTDEAKAYASSLMKDRTDEVNALVKSKRELERAIIDISYRIDGMMR